MEVAISLANAIAMKEINGNRSNGVVDPRWEQLSPREREVARLVALELKNREIADRLSIDDGTVDAHIRSIKVKTGVRSKAGISSLANAVVLNADPELQTVSENQY